MVHTNVVPGTGTGTGTIKDSSFREVGNVDKLCENRQFRQFRQFQQLRQLRQNLQFSRFFVMMPFFGT